MVSYRKIFARMIWCIVLLWPHQIMEQVCHFHLMDVTFPVPPVGYILSITNAGAIVVQCAGTFGNIIPAGPQILMPADITYIVKPKVTLCKNYIIDPGFTNTTQFTSLWPAMMEFAIAMLMMLLMVLLHGLGQVMRILLIKQMAP